MVKNFSIAILSDNRDTGSYQYKTIRNVMNVKHVDQRKLNIAIYKVITQHA